MDPDYLKATQENSNLDEFFKTVVKLKTIHRQGWMNKLGLSNPESVADHCYSMALMSMVISDMKKLDTLKMIKMSLIHDLAETITGDLTPDMISKSKKQKLENDAMRKILKSVSKSSKGDFADLWTEYQQNTTREAQLLHQIDKLEMAIQASAYVKSGFPKTSAKPFFDSAKKTITDPDLKKILSKFL